MTESSVVWVKRIGLVATPLIAVGLNLYAFSRDYEASIWNGPLQTAADIILLLYVVAYFGLLYWLLRYGTREMVIGLTVLAVSSWIAAPAVVALGLWDSQVSARTWAIVAWHWALSPLPVEVGKVFGWTAPKLRVSLFEGATLIALQVVSLGLALGIAAFLIRHLSPEKE